ncbi:hypothetical protein BMG03_09980 [Thioclava nitratireducens]|uniref:Gene transfer agent family protein n=1 Tax=Thioclava nitratireducens TaxID=1915078 RepID=A0ABM6IH66_9RHOB|nr:gene transfer agent family protein [Thioclava nitratireducens]AQS48092.1 hypothetical protein BMG03_09980 [Thioclava nitratireducens]
MTDSITLYAFFGDAERAFTLTDPMIAELERLTDLGVGAIYLKLVNHAHPAKLLKDIIRLGLIGAGTAPEEAAQLCAAYAENRPLAEVFPLAFDILEARWNGVDESETLEDVARNAEADFERFVGAAA